MVNYLFLLLALFPALAWGQMGQGGRATIMVVPWSKGDENLQDKLEADFHYRAVLNEIRLAIDRRGFSTVNFIQKLRNADRNRVAGTSNWRNTFKSIIDNSTADILIEAEVHLVEDKYGRQVEVLLEAIETSNAQSLGNSGLLKSNPFATENTALLAENALERGDELSAFLNRIQDKFNAIRRSGQPIALRIEVDRNSPYHLDTRIGTQGDLLAEKIQDWLLEKGRAWHRDGLVDGVYYHVEGRDAAILSFDFVHIPFLDVEGYRYDVNHFARELRKAIGAMGLESEKGDYFSVEDQVERNTLSLYLMN